MSTANVRKSSIFIPLDVSYNCFENSGQKYIDSGQTVTTNEHPLL